MQQKNAQHPRRPELVDMTKPSKVETDFLKENNYQHVVVSLDILPNTKAFLDAYVKLCKFNCLEDYLQDQLIAKLEVLFYDDAARNDEVNKAMQKWKLGIPSNKAAAENVEATTQCQK